METVIGNTLFQKYVIAGGPLMFALIPCSVLMLGGLLQGLLRLRRGRVTPARVARGAAAVAAGETAARRRWVMTLAKDPSPLARVVWLVLRDHPEPALVTSEELAPELDLAVAEAADEMHDGLGLLATIYTIAPLLGLLGTILGMMDTFYQFAIMGQQSLEMLSIGIQEALVTTLWGLAIAIPAFVAAQWLQAIIRKYERHHLPNAAAEVIDALGGVANGKAAHAAAAAEAEVAAGAEREA